MKCYDDATLYRFVNNDIEEKTQKEIAAHVKECQACQKIVDELKAYDSDLNKYWNEFRKECLSDDAIYRYLFGRLNKEESEKLEKHLDSCHVCKYKIKEVKEIATEFEKLSLADEKRARSSTEASEVTLLKKIASALSIYAKSNYSLDLLKDLWKTHFTFNKPIALKALAPICEPIYSAAVGDGYEKDVIQQEDSPFKIEIVQFGKQISITFQTQEEPFNNSIVRFDLQEKNDIKYSGIVFINEGIGKSLIRLDEEELERPDEERYKIVLNVLASADVFEDIKDPSSSKIIMELMKTGNANGIRMITDLLKKEKTDKK
jgi:hypothetical protein